MSEKSGIMTTEELVGRRLRAIRLNRGFSLRALSDQSGLNINTLSLIENGKTSPSVSTLQQLAMALDISISEFFNSEPVIKRVVFTSSTDRPQIKTGEAVMQNLGENLKNSSIQPFVVRMAPGTGIGDCPIVHTGHEFVFCLEGKVNYRIEDEYYELLPGDSLIFQANLPHCWKNLGESEANMVLIFSPASTDEDIACSHFSSGIKKGDINMKIAVISDNGDNISQHFGRAPYYIVFTIEEGKITNREVREKLGHNQFGGSHHEHDLNQSHGQDAASHGKHASMADAINDCQVLICGGMGMGAYESMKRLNIKPFVTDSSDPVAAVEAYVNGKLVDHVEKLH